MTVEELEKRIARVSADMLAAAKRTDFMEAASLRNELLALQSLLEDERADRPRPVE